jgi:peptide/nickel transport system permease protein
LWLALPSLLFAIAIVGALGPSFFNAMLAIGLMRVPSFARVARAGALGIRSATYVEAARAMGATPWRIAWRYVLPNVGGPLVALGSVRASTALLAGTALSFVGLGAPIPEPEWGALVAGGRPYLAEAPWLVVAPCAAIVVVALALQVAGDALQEKLDLLS